MTFVKDAWYVAALSREIADEPLARTILDTPLALFRAADGAAAAILDICPHRFAPLSKGKVINGRLQCPYHGLEFQSDGRCGHNPHGKGAIPSALRVPALPVVERDSLVWVWTGEAERADASNIPNFDCLVDPARITVGGHARVACNYRLLVDNLMDLGHSQYVHGALAASDVFNQVHREVLADGDAIIANMTFPSGPPTNLVARFLDAPQVDQWTDIRWNPVSALRNYIAFAPAGTPKAQSLNSHGTHILTPETESSCHYFFGASRNFALSDQSVSDFFVQWQNRALLSEDKPMVEAVELLTPVAQRNGMSQIMLSFDEGAVRVARKIDKLLQAEAEQLVRGAAE